MRGGERGREKERKKKRTVFIRVYQLQGVEHGGVFAIETRRAFLSDDFCALP